MNTSDGIIGDEAQVKEKSNKIKFKISKRRPKMENSIFFFMYPSLGEKKIDVKCEKLTMWSRIILKWVIPLGFNHPLEVPISDFYEPWYTWTYQ